MEQVRAGEGNAARDAIRQGSIPFVRSNPLGQDRHLQNGGIVNSGNALCQ
jgi:hypothetical protein